MEGLAAAKDAGLQVKINAVALKGVNDDEVDRLVAWCGGEGYDLTFIEVMPMGEIGEQRVDQYWPLSMLRAQLAENWALEEIDYRTGGPEIGRAHVELQSLMRISYAVFCLKKKK